jgi:hypothetical protein
MYLADAYVYFHARSIFPEKDVVPGLTLHDRHADCIYHVVR